MMLIYRTGSALLEKVHASFCVQWFSVVFEISATLKARIGVRTRVGVRIRVGVRTLAFDTKNTDICIHPST